MRTTLANLTFAFAAMLVLSPALLADGLINNEIVFTGTITSVTDNGAGTGTLFVRMSSFDLRVLVSPKTEIRDSEDQPTTMARLAELVRTTPPVDIEVSGKFSSSGTLATLVRMQQPLTPKTFKVIGHITDIRKSGEDTLISLLGIKMTATTAMITWDEVASALADLRIGMLVLASGTISTEGTWTALDIKVVSENMKREGLRFEGTVLSYDSATKVLVVEVAGAPKNTTKVQVTSSTIIEGELKPGVYVRVTGVLNEELGVTAIKIEVVPPFELKPDERKLKVGHVAWFTVSLREVAAQDVPIGLVSKPAETLQLPAAPVVVSKGSRTADFSVKALKAGSAKLTASVGADSATAAVLVGEVSDDGDDVPGSEAQIAFAPDHIQLEVGETRDVILLIKPPQDRNVEPKVEVKRDECVEFIGQRVLSNGATFLKFTVRGLAKGTSSVIVTLPKELGGAQAELLVEVGPEGRADEKKLELAFRPAKLQLKVGDIHPVELNLSRPATSNLPITLKQTGSALEILGSVEIKLGQSAASFKVKALTAGSSQVLASADGLTASLEVDVKK